MSRLRAFVVVLAGACAACVPVDEIGEQGPARAPQQFDGPFQPLDAGAAQLDGLHFTVKCYGQTEARQISEQVEALYNRVMLDTNLYSFQPRRMYQIVVYGSPDEYRNKTQMPGWSGGMTYGNAIYTYYGPGLPLTAAHEMSHLIFHEFMGPQVAGREDLRWVNEGLAVYQENKAAYPNGTQGDLFAALRPIVRSQPLAMDQMLRLVPTTERERTVSHWYAQSESMVRFMIEKGGRMGFSAFLGALRDGKSLDDAIGASYPGVFRNLSDFDQAWRRSLFL
jgi:hypothetical protein